jgi:hypothetical protein
VGGEVAKRVATFDAEKVQEIEYPNERALLKWKKDSRKWIRSHKNTGLINEKITINFGSTILL